MRVAGRIIVAVLVEAIVGSPPSTSEEKIGRMSGQAPSETTGVVPTKVLQAKATEGLRHPIARNARAGMDPCEPPLVHHVVQKIASNLPRKIEYDELVSAGTLGLVKAAKAYDPGRHAEFSTYAYIRIPRAVFDELRGRTFAPPGVNRTMRKVREAYGTLVPSTAAAEDEELATHLGLTMERLYQVLEDARRQHFLSIHGLAEDRPPSGRSWPPMRTSRPSRRPSARNSSGV